MSTLPPGPPPPLSYQGDPATPQDLDHLRVLSICWYILAGIQACISCIFLIYIIIGVLFAILGGAAGAGNRDPGAAAAGVGAGAFFICLGLIPLTFVLTIAFLNYKVGRSLVARKNLTLIYVMAAFACLGVPLGTILGIFTFVVLSRPTVKASFH